MFFQCWHYQGLRLRKKCCLLSPFPSFRRGADAEGRRTCSFRTHRACACPRSSHVVSVSWNEWNLLFWPAVVPSSAFEEEGMTPAISWLPHIRTMLWDFKGIFGRCRGEIAAFSSPPSPRRVIGHRAGEWSWKP